MRALAIGIMAALALMAGPAAFAKKPPPPGADGVIQYEETDAEMNAAIEEARRWVPAFLTALRESPAYDRASYSLKVGLPTASGGSEHIWVDTLRFENGQLVGALANHPVDLPGMSLGSRVVVDEALISDWMIVRGELAYGGYTMRVMLDDLPRPDADALRAFLAQDPIPPEWRL